MLNHRQRHWLRRLRFWAGAALATVVIALATAMALGQILLPLAARYPGRVEALLSRELGRPIHFARMQGVWRPGGPILTLSDLTLGAMQGGAALRLDQAKLRFSFGRLFWPDRHWIELSASGLELTLSRDASGRWHVAGFGGAGGASGGRGLFSLPVDLKLTGLRIEIQQGVAQPRYRLDADAVLISDRDDEMRFGANLRRVGMQRDVRVAGRFSQGGSRGMLYVAAQDADLGSLAQDVLLSGYALTRGRGDVQAWLQWRDGRLLRADARFSLADLAVSGPGGRTALVPGIAGSFGMWRTQPGWRLYYAPQARRRGEQGLLQAAYAPHGGSPWLRVQAVHLDIAPLAPLAGLLPRVSPKLSQWLGVAALHGQVLGGDFRWYGPGAYSFVGRVSGLGWAPTTRLPGIDAVDASLLGDSTAIAIELPKQPITFRYPHVLRQPLVFSAVKSTVAAWREPAGWHIGIGALDFAAAQFAGKAEGHILLRPGQPRPVLDLYADLTRGNIEAAKLFWPVNIMSPKAMAWLDRALAGGTLESGRAVFRGDTRDWPFRNEEGQFEAEARFRDATLDYDPRWPVAEDLAGSALFVDTGLTVRADRGSVLGNPLHQVVARIGDLAHATLALGAEGQGLAPQLFDFVLRSPISNHFRDAVQHLRFSGSAGWAFTLVLPLGDVHAFTLDGQAQLAQVGLEAPEWKLAVGRISGPLDFDRGGIDGKALSARFRGVSGTLALAAGPDTGKPDRLFQAALTGDFPAATLLQGIQALQPYVPRLRGAAPVTLGLHVDRGSAGQPASRTLVVDSNLAGMRVDLPAPLDKPAGASLPLRLRIGLPFDGASLDGTLGEPGAPPLLRALGRLPPAKGGGLALSLGLGGAAPPALPTGSLGGLALAGRVPVLDVSGWASVGAGGSKGRRWPLDGHVKTRDGWVFGRSFQDLDLTLHSTATGLDVLASGPALQGQLWLPTDLQQAGITANLKRLYWPAETTGPSGAAAGASPMAQIDPSTLPPLHLSVQDFHLGNARFGSAHFESTPIPGGMRIDELVSKSPNVAMNARGTWTGDARQNSTQMVIEFTANDLGRMLEALGYQNLVGGGRTLAHLDASWPGAPSAFALDALTGTLTIACTEGRILEVKPGAGRLLGLFSVAELPRRLVFDFGDVFRKGFAFDSIKGSFTLGSGDAVTHDLVIRGPAADIKVDGRTGLRAHDYDQTVSVFPKVGSTLPVIGAVTGGPVGAVAGLALQGLLGSGLSQASGTTYKVTGSWEKPTIVKVSQPSAQPARSTSASR